MTQDERNVMLEEQIQRLEGTEAIRRLKLRYAEYLSKGLSGDGPFHRDKTAALFTEDAI